MVAGIFFTFWRIMQITTLIPTLGMLSYFVHQYQKANRLTPNDVLVLFITSVLAAIWAIATLLRRKSTRRSALFVSFIDLCFVGALIASVYELRAAAKKDCTNLSADSSAFYFTVNSNGVSGDSGLNFHVNKECAMLKACFAFGIMNIIFFAITSFLLLFMKRTDDREVVVKETYRRRSHESRRGHSRSASGHHRSSRESRRPYQV